MSKCKRLAASLVLCVLLAALALPVGAVNSSFTDISDQNTAINADVLRLMGVVSGVGNNQFNPGANLTRAEFCTMVIGFMQKEDQVPLHTTRTVFSDVTAKHWGAGYVNLAASLTVKSGEQSVPLVSGVGNGKFEPDAKITMAEAATILIRVLGYSTLQTGAVWPQSYMNLAQSIGLSDGVSAGAGDNITRAQAAQLFVNALTCKTGEGGVYYESLGQAKEDVVVLAVNAETDDGSAQGAVRTSGGTYLPKAEGVTPTALQGRRGTLVLNDKNEIAAFVPDDSTATTVVLSGNAQAAYLTGTDGTRYTIPSATPVYTAAEEKSSSYATAFTDLYAGNQVTLFTERGKIVAIYSGSGTAASSDAVVVSGSVSAATFHSLTGGVTNFTIQKNRQTISLGNIKPYDVVTYDSLNNTLIVSDLRLTCVCEAASPNSKAPATVAALGHEFPVLESAWDHLDGFSVGKQITLLLTADGKVAGMAQPSGSTNSNAIGMVTGGGAEVFLPSGGTLKLSGTVSNADKLTDQLVSIASGAKGTINASRLTARKASGEFNVDEMKLGGYVVTAGVRIYEQAGDGAMAEIKRTDLTMGTISAEKVATYHLNSSNMVDYIVLENVTGSGYQYGLLMRNTQTTEREVLELDDNGNPILDSDGNWKYTTEKEEAHTWMLMRRSPISFSPKYGYIGKSGVYVGVMPGISASGDTMIRSVIELTAVKGAASSDFFESQGAYYVTVSGKTYRVADEVECCYGVSNDPYNPYSADNWFQQSSGEERLAACRAESNNMTLYIDPIGEQVRIIVVN